MLRLQSSAPLLGGVALLLGTVSAPGQGTFQNLDFELANVPVVPSNQFGGFVSTGDGMPGWNVFLGTSQQTQVLHNNLSFGSAAVAILGPDFLNYIVEGAYTAALTGGRDPAQPSSPMDASVSQVGVVPSQARSLWLEAGTAGPPGGNFVVSLAGTQIAMLPLAVGPNYTLYGGDITAMAGMTAELKITAPANLLPSLNFVTIDSIQFSAQAVPEPSVFGLAALGTLLLGWRILRRQRC
jgi:hypothetical protein